MEYIKKQLLQLKDKTYILNFSIKIILLNSVGILLPIASIICCAKSLSNEIKLQPKASHFTPLANMLIGTYVSQMVLGILVMIRDVMNLWSWMKNVNVSSMRPLDCIILSYGVFWSILLFAISIFGQLMYFLYKEIQLMRCLSFSILTLMIEMYVMIAVVVIYFILCCLRR